MEDSYLEVTFRHGRLLAAYYYLPREGEVRVDRAVPVEAGLVIDYDQNGTPIGVEITSPTKLTLDDFNNVLSRIGCPRVDAKELAPLQAA